MNRNSGTSFREQSRFSQVWVLHMSEMEAGTDLALPTPVHPAGACFIHDPGKSPREGIRVVQSIETSGLSAWTALPRGASQRLWRDRRSKPMNAKFDRHCSRNAHAQDRSRWSGFRDVD